jgi:hypothetical protein
MCFGGREDVEAKRSREIDALIHRDEKVMQKVVKLLLLGEPICPRPWCPAPIPNLIWLIATYRSWRKW